MSETTTREVVLTMEAFEKLQELQKKRGFPEKLVSESDIVEEAIRKLYTEVMKVE